MALADHEAQESLRKKRMEDRLKAKVTVGVEQQEDAIHTVLNTTIVDRLVDPKATNFFRTVDQVGRGGEEVRMQVGDGLLRKIHPHALGQIASTMDISRKYVRRLAAGEAWEKELLAHNLNTLFQMGTYIDRKKNPAKFLHRLVGDELRGFLSRSYNRKLLTAPLLRAYLERCGLHGAGPIAAHTSSIRTTIKCVLPMVFEPVDGEFVAFGVSFTNSDFGSGRLKLSGTVMRVESGTISVLEDKYSKTHLGSVIQESDIVMSDETADKEVAAVVSAIKDTIDAVLSEESVTVALAAIQRAHEEEIPWYKLKDALSGILGKKDVEFLKTIIDKGPEVVDLPPLKNDALTGWGAANLVGWFADSEKDQDKKSDLQALAGKMIKAA